MLDYTVNTLDSISRNMSAAEEIDIRKYAGNLVTIVTRSLESFGREDHNIIAMKEILCFTKGAILNLIFCL